jgi:hypothetical protein
MEKSKGREKNEMLLKHRETKRGYQRVLPSEKAFKSSEVQVREKRFSIHQSKGEKVNSRREADRGKDSKRDQACHLQVNGTMSNPTPHNLPFGKHADFLEGVLAFRRVEHSERKGREQCCPYA